MRDEVPCEFPPGYDGSAVLARLSQVRDPELDESILDLGFVHSLHLHSGHATIALRLPTSWCAVNFAYLMAEDVRWALLAVEGIGQVTVHRSSARRPQACGAICSAGPSSVSTAAPRSR
jgi:metal-sulfur cluster biosynthetic enzyme